MPSRPQDPRTQKIRDEEDRIATLRPRSRPADDDVPATVFPDPDATAVPGGLEPPKPKTTSSGLVRGGAAAGPRTWAGQDDAPAAPVVVAPLQPKRAPTETVLRPRAAKRTSWTVWVLAFLVLAGIGFGVSWFLMNPQGAGDSAKTAETVEPPKDVAEPAVEADAAVAAEADAAVEADAQVAQVEADAAVAAEADAQVADVAAEADAQLAAEAAADVQVAQVENDVAAEADVQLAAEAAVAQVENDAQVAPADTQVQADTQAPEADTQVAQVAPEPALPPKSPAEANRLNEAGLNARKAGDHARATSLYTEALKFNPDHVWARYNLACELALAGKSREAFAELTTLYKLGTADSRRALGAARKDSDFDSIRDSGQFFRLTNF